MPMAHEVGEPTCLHHTFAHAKALAALLCARGEVAKEAAPLPCEVGFGVKTYQNGNLVLLSNGVFRATLSTVRAKCLPDYAGGGGGSLNLLYHKDYGVICAATSAVYQPSEVLNQQYLRNAGANPTDVYDMFKASPKDLAMESRFHTSIMLYKNNIAIASCDGENDESYRIIASKAADKMLTLQNIDAAFALVSIGDQIHISGRSQGNVNVQLILERLGGGGHFDVAGAQVLSDSIIGVLEQLKDSIDNYLDS
jgi:hypothetical protein